MVINQMIDGLTYVTPGTLSACGGGGVLLSRSLWKRGPSNFFSHPKGSR
jgi:hypothetical protein